jgi:hypothetical protein
MCHGGQSAIPDGDDGRRLLVYIDDCLRQARGSIGKRLRKTRQKA